MKSKIIINQEFEYLRPVIESIPDSFKWMGVTVQAGRNEIKYFDTHGITLVIKYFNKITLINRIIYALFRKPKSQRSFENSMYLIKNGINTPTPIAYVSLYESFMLVKDFFIYVHLDFQHLNRLLSNPLPESANALRDFARFTYSLHNKGIFHGDYHFKNILYSNDGSYYSFALIDNNRIKIDRYNYKKGLSNLKRLQLPIENLAVICSEYSRLSKVDELKTTFDIILFRLQYLGFMAFKRKLKSFFM